MTAIPQTEAEFQASVIEYAHVNSWVVAHFRPGRTADGGWRTPVAADGKGFPDLVLVRERVVFAELKSATGRLTHDQRAWAEWLGRAAAEHYVWSPDDWPAIERILGGARQRPVVA